MASSVVDTQSTKSASKSPVRRLSEGVAFLGAALSRALSSDGTEKRAFGENASNDAKERSRSRGREFKSSGRGGAGNIRSAALVDEGSYIDSVPVRGREAVDTPTGHAIMSTGRGGAGNFRSPSRDPGAAASRAHDDEVVRANVEASQGVIHSSGRGGAGNIVGARTASSSRSRSRGPAIHLTGRGGAGNIVLKETPYGDEKAFAEDDAARGRASAAHSTGRGGAANIHAGPAPPTEPSPAHAHGVESTGRGGAGNILRGVLNRSLSRDPSVPRASAAAAAASIDGSAPLARGRERVPYGGAAAPGAHEGEARGETERAVDARAGTRSRSREVSAASARSGREEKPGFWERVRHPLSPRASYTGEATIRE